MGYTVSWYQNRPFTMQEWGDIRAAVIPMFNRLKQIKGGNGTGRPIIDNSDIIFNGDASKGEDHETFQLMKNGGDFQFCKTARKPYDRFVKAVLIIANFYAPGALKVSCDGDNEPDCWTEGVRIASIYAKGLREGCSPCSPLEQVPPKAPEVAKSVYEGNIDTAIGKIAKMAEFMDDKTIAFLANYLKANIDDIKDAWVP
jgi:hypothetical protein